MEQGACAPCSIHGVIKEYERHGHDREMITMTAPIRFTRVRNLFDETEYRHETEKHRFIVRRTNDSSKLWAIEVWTLKTVGMIEPVLKIADQRVDTLFVGMLSWAREDIAAYIARHG